LTLPHLAIARAMGVGVESMAYESHTFRTDASKTFSAKRGHLAFNERMTFGENLQRLLKAKGLSQSALARRLGVTPQAVGQWCRAVTEPKDLTRFQDVAKILGVDAQELWATEDHQAAAGGLEAHVVADPGVELALSPKGNSEIPIDVPGRIYMLSLWDILDPIERESVLMHARAFVNRRRPG
jgi:transcriptional regulator with XRE-family HTH domain